LLWNGIAVASENRARAAATVRARSAADQKQPTAEFDRDGRGESERWQRNPAAPIMPIVAP